MARDPILEKYFPSAPERRVPRGRPKGRNRSRFDRHLPGQEHEDEDRPRGRSRFDRHLKDEGPESSNKPSPTEPPAPAPARKTIGGVQLPGSIGEAAGQLVGGLAAAPWKALEMMAEPGAKALDYLGDYKPGTTMAAAQAVAWPMNVWPCWKKPEPW